MLYEPVGAGTSQSSSQPELGFRGFRSVSRWTLYPLKCLWKDCKRELPCRSMLERHITKHCREAPKVQGKRACSWRTGCLTSPNTFREVSDLVAHVNARHVSFLPWPCPAKDCSMVFNAEAALRSHFEQTHSTVSRNALRDSLKPSSPVLANPFPLPNQYPTYLLLMPEPLPATFTGANIVRPSVKGIDWDELDLDDDATAPTTSTPRLIQSKANMGPKRTLLNGVPEPLPSFVSPVVSAPQKIAWESLSEDLKTNKYDWSGIVVRPSSPSSIVNRTPQLSWPPPRRPPSPSPPPLLPPSAKHFIVNRDMIIERHVPIPGPVSIPVSPSSPTRTAADTAAAAVAPKARPRVPPSPARLQAISRKRRKTGEGDIHQGLEFGREDEDDTLTLMDDDIGAKPYTKSEGLVTGRRARKSTGSVYRRIPSSPLL